MEALDVLPLNVIAGGWLHVNFFVGVEFAIEVGTIEVESVNIPVIAGGNGENESKTGETCNWGEGVEVVNAKLLCEASSDEAGLVLFYGPIGLPFDVKNPFAADDVLVGGSGNVNPGSHTFEAVDFTVHGLLPF